MTVNMERDLKHLLQRHSTQLASLKASLADVVGAGPSPDAHVGPHDDLFLLRYVLSADGDLGKAEAKIRDTLAWRKDKAALLQAAKDGTPPPHSELFRRHLAVDIHGTSKEGDIVLIIRAGISNTKALLDDNGQLTVDDVVDHMMFKREQVYLMIDAATRRSGRLCKAITITDLNHASLKKMHKHFPSVLGTISKLSDRYYPQFLETGVILNMPTVMKAVMGMVMSLMPKRVQAKVKVCPARTLKEPISKCPYISQHFDADTLPSFLGGKCKCAHKGGCILGIPNDQKEANPENEDEDGMSLWTLNKKGKYEVFLNVQEGTTITYAFSIEKKAMMSSSVIVSANLQNELGEINLLREHKYKPEAGVVRGDFPCPEAGTMVFSFSNCSSMMTRNIKYCVIAISKDGDVAEEDGHKEGVSAVTD